MDAILNDRWIKGLSPFDGATIHVQLVPIHEVVQSIGILLCELKAAEIGSVYTYDDWHAHDGYVTERKEIAWTTLEELIASKESLIADRTGDDYVRRAFYPPDYSFLLRIYVDDDAAPEWMASFDLTSPLAITDRLAWLLPTSVQPELGIERAIAYFNRTYAG